MDTDDTYLFKVVVVGARGVGKTAMMLRYSEGDEFKFDEERPYNFCDFKMKHLEIDGRTVKLQYFKNIIGVVVLYDVTDKDSLEEVDFIVDCIDRSAPEGCIKVLCGNKSDLTDEKVISSEEGMKKAENLNMMFFETSVK